MKINCWKSGGVSLILVFISTAGIAGGGWPQPRGKGYFKLGLSRDIAIIKIFFEIC